jgi:hypothetical protein
MIMLALITSQQRPSGLPHESFRKNAKLAKIICDWWHACLLY